MVARPSASRLMTSGAIGGGGPWMMVGATTNPALPVPPGDRAGAATSMADGPGPAEFPGTGPAMPSPAGSPGRGAVTGVGLPAGNTGAGGRANAAARTRRALSSSWRANSPDIVPSTVVANSTRPLVAFTSSAVSRIRSASRW